MKVNKILETMDYGTAPESSTVALKWIEERGADFRLFINGVFVKPSGRKSFATHNPANDELLAKLYQAQSGDVDAAVNAARGAQTDWESMGGSPPLPDRSLCAKV